MSELGNRVEKKREKPKCDKATYNVGIKDRSKSSTPKLNIKVDVCDDDGMDSVLAETLEKFDKIELEKHQNYTRDVT